MVYYHKKKNEINSIVIRVESRLTRTYEESRPVDLIFAHLMESPPLEILTLPQAGIIFGRAEFIVFLDFEGSIVEKYPTIFCRMVWLGLYFLS